MLAARVVRVKAFFIVSPVLNRVVCGVADLQQRDPDEALRLT